MIPYGRQDISQEDIDAVVDVLRSDFLTQGPCVPEFERLVGEAVNARYAVAVNSATSALHIACIALGLGSGDILWTVPTSFVASANCGLYCGAKVDFVDIDPQTYTMSPSALKAKLEIAAQAGELPKVIVPVHLCGQSADMAEISKLARRYGVYLIEDASHSIGAEHEDEPVGDCRYSDITVFSFHPVKIVTTAEGGVATTNDKKLARSMQLARSHGVTREPDEIVGGSEGPWYYQQVSLGYNYRLTELQAALGISQLTRLSEFVKRRRELAFNYFQVLRDLPVTLPFQRDQTNSSWHLYVIRVEASVRRRVFENLRSKGIGVNLHYIPIHTQPYYRALGFKPGQFPEAEAYYSEAISIPLYPGMTNADQDRVVSALADSLEASGL